MGTQKAAGVSLVGMTGALLGLVPPLFVATLLWLFDPPGGERPVTDLLLIAAGAMYLPALWVSVAPTPARRTVLLGSSLLMLVPSLAFLATALGENGIMPILFIVPPALLLLGAARCKEGQP